MRNRVYYDKSCFKVITCVCWRFRPTIRGWWVDKFFQIALWWVKTGQKDHLTYYDHSSSLRCNSMSAVKYYLNFLHFVLTCKDHVASWCSCYIHGWPRLHHLDSSLWHTQILQTAYIALRIAWKFWTIFRTTHTITGETGRMFVVK